MADELDRVIEFVAGWAGIDLTHSREALRRVIAARRGAATHAAYLARLGAADDPERVALADALGVAPRWFLRDDGDAAVIADLPARRIWCVGCATGEDAHTIAMLAPHAEILATDLNTRALAIAEEARYGAWSLRRLPDSLRVFAPEGQVVPAVRARVRVARHNLLDPAPGTFDLIYARDALARLTLDAQRIAIDRITAALAYDGSLLIGDHPIAPHPRLRETRVPRRVLRAVTVPVRRAAAPRVAAPTRPMPMTHDLAPADAALAAGRHDEAIERYVAALTDEPMRTEAWHALAIAHDRAGDPISAAHARSMLRDP